MIVADTRWYLDGRSGLEAFCLGHLPGAVFVDIDRWLSGRKDGGSRHPLPPPEVFARGMSELGIGDASVVVGYDDAGGVIAARLVWMLRVLGRRAAVLDGGIASYDGPLETGVVDPDPAMFTAQPWPLDRLADIDAVCDSDSLVVDARNRDRYRGDYEPVDPRAHSGRGEPAVPGEPGRGRQTGRGRGVAAQVCRSRCVRRSRRDFVLRLRGYCVSQSAHHGACRHHPRKTVSGKLVGVRVCR